MPPAAKGADIAKAINERFNRDVTKHKSFEAGVLIHQLDGFEDQNRRWAPCGSKSQSANCRGPRTSARKQRVSTSMIFNSLKGRDTAIPTFSLDGGVILTPSKINALCGYGIDGSIDDNKPLSCSKRSCVPGCGDPPAWCNKNNPHDEGAWATCGLAWTAGGVRPWRPDDFGGHGGLFDLFSKETIPFEGVGNYKGYNEIVVDSDAWVNALPHSVEAIFMIECNDNDANLRYGAADGGGTAWNCRDAHTNAMALHRAYLEAYHLSSAEFPLLKLRPRNWAEPFVAMFDANADVNKGHAAAAPSTTPVPSAAAPSMPLLPLPPTRCHTCNEHHANGNGLTPAKCDAMLRDRHGKMWSMWAVNGWSRRAPGETACFQSGWQHMTFDAALRGEGCNRNWLEGTHDTPRFPRPAPALLGFDETIYAYCGAAIGQNEGPFYQDNVGLAQRCTQANENVLRVMGGWNMCTNLQWQFCAMKGLLHGQGNRHMHFSIAPKDLDVGIFNNPDQCVNGCQSGYAISDVYFAEVCVVSHVCRNREQLFSGEVGRLFECDIDEDAFRELGQILSG